MSIEWKKYTVSDLEKANLLKVEDGNHGEYRPRPNEFVKEGTAFIRSADLDNGIILFHSASRISETAVKRIKKGIGQKGDTLFSSKGTVGKIALASLDCELFICSPQVTFWRSLDHNFLNYQFLYYYIQSPEFLHQVTSRSRETDMAPYISLTNQREFEISIPDIEEQKQIASVLSCLDAKIDNLRRQNETLEKIAQLLFKRWFIDFEFPNDDGQPYKSSGGDFVSSELGDIPLGWKVGKLEDCLSIIIDYRGKTPKKLGSDWSLQGIPALSAKNIKDGQLIREDSINFVDEDLYKKWMKDELQKGDVLLTSEAPLGELYYLANNQKYVLSQRLFALRVNQVISASYLYYWLKSVQGQYLLQRRATGSTVQGIRQVELKKVEIIIPCEQIIKKITLTWNSLLDKIENNNAQIQTLTKNRDLLLPKLMSGEIRVREGED